MNAIPGLTVIQRKDGFHIDSRCMSQIKILRDIIKDIKGKKIP